MQEATRAIRNTRAESNIEPGRRIAAIVAGPYGADFDALRAEFAFLARIATDKLDIAADAAAPEGAITMPWKISPSTCRWATSLDLDAERTRLAREIEAAEAEVGRASAQLANEGFIARAPEKVVQVQRDRLAGAQERVRLLQERLAALG